MGAAGRLAGGAWTFSGERAASVVIRRRAVLRQWAAPRRRVVIVLRCGFLRSYGVGFKGGSCASGRSATPERGGRLRRQSSSAGLLVFKRRSSGSWCDRLRLGFSGVRLLKLLFSILSEWSVNKVLHASGLILAVYSGSYRVGLNPLRFSLSESLEWLSLLCFSAVTDVG